MTKDEEQASAALAMHQLRPTIRKVVSTDDDPAYWVGRIQRQMKLRHGCELEAAAIERQMMGYFEDLWEAFSSFPQNAADFIEKHRLHEHSHLSMADIRSKVQ